MKLRRIIALVLALVLLLGLVAGAISASAAETWEENVLTKDPMEVFGMDPKYILSVTFRDSLENAPENSWNMGRCGTDKVKAWIEWEEAGCHVYFAAQGGINGVDSAEGLFRNLKNLKEVNFNGAYHTEQAQSLAEMFRNCTKLETVDVQNLNTANAESLYCMFAGCRSLTGLDLGGFDTAKVTNMGHMFANCKKLETLNVTGWNTEKVTNMEGMFGNCEEVVNPDFSGWNVNAVINHNGFMNPGCQIGGEPWEKLFA